LGFRLPRLSSNSYPALKHWARVTGNSYLIGKGRVADQPGVESF
jgi:hypothetical protein